jgi:hypothetical protein
MTNDNAGGSNLKDSLSSPPDPEILKYVLKGGYEADSKRLASNLTGKFYVAFDTNTLKEFRIGNANIEVEKMLDEIEDLNNSGDEVHLDLILPGQAYLEYFNNHSVFSGVDLQKVKRTFDTLLKSLKDDDLDVITAQGGIDGTSGEEFKAKIEGFIAKAAVVQDRASAEVAYEVLATLLRGGATIPFVSRAEYYDIGFSRLSSSIPPGWDDFKKKDIRSLGDFYIWADLLSGVLSAEGEVNLDFNPGATQDWQPREGGVIFLSDDVKEDWTIVDAAVPYLRAECIGSTGLDLYKMRYNEFKKVISSRSGK